MPKFIEDDGILLPEFLFHFSSQKSKSISPAASLNPATAIDGQAFENSTSPSSAPAKKTLIIDKNSLNTYKDYGERIALLKRLKVAGFKVFLRSQPTENHQSPFYELDNNLTDIEKLNNLSQFDETEDYGQLAKQGVERDKALLLDHQDLLQTSDIIRSFSDTNYAGRFFGNDWQCQFRDDRPNDGKVLTQGELLYSLNRVSSEELPALIKNYFDELTISDGENIDLWKKYETVGYENLLEGEQRKLINVENRNRLFIIEAAELIVTSHDANVKQHIVDLGSKTKDVFENFKEFVRSANLGHDSSTSTIICAAKLFPDHKKEIFNKYLRPKNASSFVSLMEHFPQDSSLIIDLFTKYAEDPSKDRNSLNILLNIYKKKAVEDNEKSRELDDLLQQTNYWIDLLTNFARAESQSGLGNFYEEKLLKLLYERIVQKNGSILHELYFALNYSSPRTAEKIVTMIFEKDGALSLLSKKSSDYGINSHIHIDLRNNLIKACPQRAEELARFFSKYETDRYSLTIDEALATKYSSDSNAKPKQTYLEIVNLDSEEKVARLDSQIDSDAFRDIATIRFIGGNAQQIQRSLMSISNAAEIDKPERARLRNSLKHVVLSKMPPHDLEPIFKTLISLNISYEIIDDSNYLGIKEDEEARKSFQHQQSSLTPKKNKIRIAQNGLNSSLEVENSETDPVFDMALAGEVLNAAHLTSPQIRTSIITTEITENLKQESYTPKKFKTAEVLQSLSEEEIEEFRKKPSSKVYYKFNQSLAAGKKFRLSSVDAAEDFVGIFGSTDEIKIEKGDDDFLYATSSKDRILTYIVSARNQKEDISDYDSLPSSNPIKKIIDEYRDPKKGFKVEALGEKKNVSYNIQDHKGSMEKMFKERSGVCRHRVAAVEYKLRTSKEINQDDFRVVDINNNHVVLEIKAKGKWIKVDLGGGAAQENILSEDSKYSAPEVVEKPIVPEKSLGNLAETMEVETDTEAKEQEPSDESDKENEDTNPKSSSPKKRQEKKQTPEEIAAAEKKRAEELKDALKRKAAAEALAKFNEAKKKALAALAKSLISVSKLEEIAEASKLKDQTTSSKKNKILVVTEKIEDHANFFLHEAASGKRDIFYIDNPSKIDLHRTNLLIANDNSPNLTQDGLLSDFLQRSGLNPKRKPEERPLLVINWSAFDPKQKVALNTVLDQRRCINGVEIDDSIQIIGLSDSASQDPSFLSRHDLSIGSKTNLPNLTAEEKEEEKTTIDLQGFPNWRRFLFGKVVLVGNKMEWQKSEFVKAIEAGNSNFEIINLSTKAAQELKREFAQAKALEKFTYHGHDIALPKRININCKGNSFDFSKFNDPSKKIKAAIEVTLDKAPLDAELINTNLFDLLLCDKEIENEQYKETLGLIEKSKDQTLKLFISSELSESQWYCLFNESQKHNVELELYLAPKVKIPSNVEFEKIQDIANKREVEAKIFVTNDCDATLEKIKKDNGDLFAIVDAEDCTYQDLIEKTTFKTTASGFEDFKKIKSEFLTNLESDKKIVLKGQFSADLLQMLEPILITNIGKNLTLIVEDKACREGVVPDSLKWIAQENCNIERHNEQKTSSTEIPRFETQETDDLEDSKKKAETFIKDRKAALLKTLEGNSMIRLTGHSGVGKSSLMRELEKESTAAIYRELSNIEDWANDKSNKPKILFIDESNIEDRHFTTFSPLKNGDAQKIFYQGKFYDLDKHHKVAFAHNEIGYGGGRVRQKLFDDGKIPALPLRDFPTCYIYEKILKEAIFDCLGEDLKSKISESGFKKICQELITEYHQINSQKKSKEDENPETVRELQNKVLIEISNSVNEELKEIKSRNFISTSATAEIERALDTALNIKLAQKNKNLPQKSVGLNGVLLEGDSGVGKSELIAATLASKGITEIKIGEMPDPEKQQFYKIDANLPIAQKKELIVKAFEEGNIVWIDEINSCIDDGLEKILNAALTGDHPDAKKDFIANPGFMLISSVNSAGLEGRSIISPALLHRTIQPKVKSLKEYSCEDFTKIIEHWLSQEKEDSGAFVESNLLHQVCGNIADHFIKCLQSSDGGNLNLRMLRNNLEKILPAHVELAQLQNGLNHSPSITPLASTNHGIDLFTAQPIESPLKDLEPELKSLTHVIEGKIPTKTTTSSLPKKLVKPVVTTTSSKKSLPKFSVHYNQEIKDEFSQYFKNEATKEVSQRQLNEEFRAEIKVQAISDNKILSQEGSGKSFSAKEAAKVKLQDLADKHIKFEPGTNKKNFVKELAEFSAVGVAVKAIKSSFNDKVEEEVGKTKIDQVAFAKTSKDHQRHMRISFQDVDFSSAYLNSFANCEFDGACKFDNLAFGKNKFVNCTFGESCNVEQAKELVKLGADNLSACKFSPKFIDKLGDETEQQKFKESLKIGGDLVGGYYQNSAKKPSPEFAPTAAFKIKETGIIKKMGG